MGIDGHLTRKQFLGIAATTLVAPKAAMALEEPEQSTTDISVADMKVADKFGAAEFDEVHHKLALPGVKKNISNFSTIRNLGLKNEVEPLLAFSPSGRQEGEGSRVSIKGLSNQTRQTTSDEDLAYLSTVELSQMVKSKKLSPVELTEIYLKRLKTYGSKLNCVVTLTEELAMQQAKVAQEEISKGHYRGRLHGIPYGIKDLFSVAGYRTTWGAEAFKDQMIDHDCAVVEKLNAAGAICLAKLSCGALAYDDVWWGGQTKNPWNVKQGSSGSSAGSACASAAGLVGFAIGTETLGSIISPSNRCRVSGLRPTYGRVSRYGGMVLTWTMDKVGPIARTIEDCAVVLGSIIGKDPRDIATVNRNFTYDSKINLSKLKIGVLVGEKESPIETADWAKILQQNGAKLSPVKFSEAPEGIWTLLVAEAAAFFDKLTRSEGIDKIGKLWPPEFLAARYVPAVEYINAHRARAIMAAKFEEEFADFDVIVTDHFWDDAFTICNGTGHPQAIIPWGTKGSEPRSVSVIGRLYKEGEMAAVANVLQRSSTFHLQRPDSKSWG